MSDLPPTADTVISPDDPQFAEPPKWPKVVGIISVVWGVINFGCVGCGMLFSFWGSMFSKQMEEAFPDGVPPQLSQGPSVFLLALMGAGAVMALWLVVAGIVLLTRKYAARMLHLSWVGVSVVLSFVSMYNQMSQQQAMHQWIRDHPNSKFAQNQAAFGGIGEIVGWVVGLGIGLGYPIFCGVWFGFVKKNPEEYTRGVEQLM